MIYLACSQLWQAYLRVRSYALEKENCEWCLSQTDLRADIQCHDQSVLELVPLSGAL